MDAALPDLGERKLGLEYGQVVAVAGLAVLGAEGMGQTRQPFAEECLDLLFVQPITKALGGGDIRAGEQTIVQRLKGDPALG
jgi:hypothetical protein